MKRIDTYWKEYLFKSNSRSLHKNENYNNIMNATGHKTSQMIRYYDYRNKIKNNAINLFSDLF